MTDIAKILAQELGIKTTQVEATIKLIDEGNTIPFISRYRKEVTGSLNDEILRQFDERLRYLRNLEEKKEQVISAIEEQGKLTEELKKEIESAMTLVAVDDLYRPFRPKRRTRAMIAIEKGLENFANDIYEEKLQRPAIEEGEKYLSNKVFIGKIGVSLKPNEEDVLGFEKFMESYIKGLEIEKLSGKLFL